MSSLPSSGPSIPGSRCSSGRRLGDRWNDRGGCWPGGSHPPERADAGLQDPASTQNMDSHRIYSQPVRGQGRGASRQGVRRPGRRGCQRAQNGLGETGGLTYAPRPPGVTRRTPDIASGFTHSKLCISHDGMQAGRLLAREQVQLGVGTVRDPFLAGAYIRRTSLLCDSPRTLHFQFSMVGIFV